MLDAALVSSLTLASKLSSAAYDIDEARAKADFEALGCEYVGLASEPARWVYVLRSPASNPIFGACNIIDGQGTRVTENFSAEELLCDVDLIPVRTPWGLAPNGFYSPAMRLLPKIVPLLNPSLPTVAIGHSLGAETVQMFGPELPGMSIYPIDPPTGASHEFISALRTRSKVVVPYVRERSFAWGWGVGLTYHQCFPFVWQRNTGQIAEVTERSTAVNISEPDHDIETTIATLERATQ